MVDMLSHGAGCGCSVCMAERESDSEVTIQEPVEDISMYLREDGYMTDQNLDPKVGDVKVLVLRGTFGDGTEVTSEADLAATAQQANDYFDYASGGKMNIEHDVASEVFQFDEASSDYPRQMREAATAAGYDLDEYDVVHFSVSGLDIGAGALGVFNEGLSRGEIIAPPGVDDSGYIHELGHALGVGHPRTIEAGADAYPLLDEPGGEWAGGEQVHNMMGSGPGAGGGSDNGTHELNLPPWNLASKYKVGWFKDEDFVDARESGTFTFYTDDFAGEAVEGRQYGARIMLSDGRNGFDAGTHAPNLFLSFQPDNDFRTSTANTGIILETLNNQIGFQIDATPDSIAGFTNPSNWRPVEQYGDSTDAHLTVGNEIELPFGYKIAVLETAGSGDDANVTIRVVKEGDTDVPPGLAVVGVAEAVSAASDLEGGLIVGEIRVFGEDVPEGSVSLSGRDADLFEITDNFLVLREDADFANLADLDVSVELDDPRFDGVESVRAVTIDVDTETEIIEASTVDATDLINGLERTYLEEPDVNLGERIEFGEAMDSATEVVERIQSRPRTEFSDDGYQFTGFLEIPEDGFYRFSSINNYHSQFTISGVDAIARSDDELVAPGIDVEDRIVHETQGDFVFLQAGFHEINYSWFGGGNYNTNTISLFWEGPGIGRSAVPNESFFVDEQANTRFTGNAGDFTFEITGTGALAVISTQLVNGFPVTNVFQDPVSLDFDDQTVTAAPLGQGFEVTFADGTVLLLGDTEAPSDDEVEAGDASEQDASADASEDISDADAPVDDTGETTPDASVDTPDVDTSDTETLPEDPGVTTPDVMADTPDSETPTTETPTTETPTTETPTTETGSDLRGTSRADQIEGTQANDTIAGRGGDDTLMGGDGEDRLAGQGGNDTLFGDEGNDRLFGGSADDELFGGDGNDLLRAGSGTDRLDGGAGDDTLIGGRGSDTFVYTEEGGNDTVKSFNSDEDEIDLTGLMLDNLDEALANATQVGNDTVFIFDEENTLTIEDTTIEQLQDNLLIL